MYYNGELQCDAPFSKWGSIYNFVLCFGIPVLVNGFCHTCIAIVLNKSMKAEKHIRDKLVPRLFIINLLQIAFQMVCCIIYSKMFCC